MKFVYDMQGFRSHFYGSLTASLFFDEYLKKEKWQSPKNQEELKYVAIVVRKLYPPKPERVYLKGI